MVDLKKIIRAALAILEFYTAWNAGRPVNTAVAVLFDRFAFAGSSAFAKVDDHPIADVRGYALPLATICRDLLGFSGTRWRMRSV